MSNGYAGLTKVTGGYGPSVDRVYVANSRVTTATNGQVKGMGGYSQQVDDKSEGGNLSMVDYPELQTCKDSLSQCNGRRYLFRYA